MTLATALNAAMSGLGVTARRAEIASANVANAATDGYARRSLQVIPGHETPGVRAVGVQRHVDTALLADTRLSRGESAENALLARQIERLEAAVGKAGASDGIAAGIARLEAALVTASGNPASDAALAEVADAASALARQFARASDTVQTVRAEADSRIAAETKALQDGLRDIAAIDRKIASLGPSGSDVSALRDQRQMRIDSLSAIVPLREVTRKDGQTMLVSANGAILLDGRAASLTFDRTPVMAADRTAPLPPVVMDGRPVSAGPDGPLSGGTLAAALDLRDRLTPDLQAGLDALALKVESRLRLADASLATGEPGLLTDDGRVGDGSRAAGLSARLDLNRNADFEGQGALWKVRSGLGAAQPSPPGDSSTLLSLRSALADGPAADAADLTERLVYRRVVAEDRAATSAARQATLAEQLGQSGVDTDREMLDLMQIERAFAANARVLRVVDEMLQTLLER